MISISKWTVRSCRERLGLRNELWCVRRLSAYLSASTKEESADCLCALLSTATKNVSPSDSVLSLVFHTVNNLLSFGNDERVVNRLVVKVCKNLSCFLFAAVCNKPSVQHLLVNDGQEAQFVWLRHT